MPLCPYVPSADARNKSNTAPLKPNAIMVSTNANTRAVGADYPLHHLAVRLLPHQFPDYRTRFAPAFSIQYFPSMLRHSRRCDGRNPVSCVLNSVYS